MKFEPEDFKSVAISSDWKTVAESAAFWANTRLAEMLAEAPRVFMSKGIGHFDAWTVNGSDLDAAPSHTAKLVCIEAIK